MMKSLLLVVLALVSLTGCGTAPGSVLATKALTPKAAAASIKGPLTVTSVTGGLSPSLVAKDTLTITGRDTDEAFKLVLITGRVRNELAPNFNTIYVSSVTLNGQAVTDRRALASKLSATAAQLSGSRAQVLSEAAVLLRQP